jgi:hypothetical protein
MDLISMDTPRPTLETNGSFRGAAARQRVWTRHRQTILAIPKDDEAVVRKVLATLRRRQTRKLGSRDEDPDPYATSYIFYCLDGRRET